MIKKTFILILFALVFASCSMRKPARESYVLLVSFDAFRYDYVERYDAPNFKQFIKNGIAAESMISTYPSKTFANHYSIITGLHAGNNGLVDNTFYDPALNTTYTTSNRSLVENPVFYGGLPLWQLVQQNGMKSASFFWPGSETKIAGNHPDYWKLYDGRISNNARIDSVMNWLKLPAEKRPRFITLYFSFTDDIGHRYGPYSKEMKDAVLKADRLVGQITNKLKKIDLDVNVIVVSDHGMVEIEPKAENILSEDDIFAGLDTAKIITTKSGTHIRFYCKDQSYKDELYKTLKSKENHFTVYKRDETPVRWHCRDNNRVGDVLLVMDPGYEEVSKEKKEEILKAAVKTGVHGYDPETKDVQGIFYAQGPQIAKGQRIPSFENVNIYPFIAELLGIKSYPAIDGKKEILEKYIKK